VAVELTLVLRFEDNNWVPTNEDIEFEFDCMVVEREEEVKKEADNGR
jgi:hypothetical protein